MNIVKKKKKTGGIFKLKFLQSTNIASKTTEKHQIH